MHANAYGLLEVNGLVTGIEAADAMIKSAPVRLVAQLKTDPGLITLVVEGDIGACGAAIDAGRAAASRVGTVVSSKLIGRPEPDIGLFFAEPAPPTPSPPPPPRPPVVFTEPSQPAVVPSAAPSIAAVEHDATPKPTPLPPQPQPPRRRKRSQ